MSPYTWRVNRARSLATNHPEALEVMTARSRWARTASKAPEVFQAQAAAGARTRIAA